MKAFKIIFQCRLAARILMITTMIIILIMSKPHVMITIYEGNKIILQCRLAGRIMLIMTMIMIMIMPKPHVMRNFDEGNKPSSRAGWQLGF